MTLPVKAETETKGIPVVSHPLAAYRLLLRWYYALKYGGFIRQPRGPATKIEQRAKPVVLRPQQADVDAAAFPSLAALVRKSRPCDFHRQTDTHTHTHTHTHARTPSCVLSYVTQIR